MASLLLRLFHSDYFSPHLALSYLRTYSDNIGITYYLVYRLRTSFQPEEVEFYWPQLCHLLITKPSESRALECFVLERCEESVHVALLTLWYLQAALFDLGHQPHTASFEVCKRVYNECQRVLYDDPLSDANVSLVSSSASSSSSRNRLRRFVSSSARARERVNPRNTRSTYVGVGTVLASAPGMPSLADFSGRVAVEQGRAKPNRFDGSKGDKGEGLATGIERIAKGDESDEEESKFTAQDFHRDDDSDDDAADNASGSEDSDGPSRAPPKTKLTEQSNRRVVSESAAKAPPSILVGSNKNPATASNPFASMSAGFNDFRNKTTAAVGEAFGQTFGVQFPGAGPNDSNDSKARPAWHPHKGAKRKEEQSSAKSTPNLNGSRTSLSAFASMATLPDSNNPASVDAVLAQYDSEARRRLLRSNYCRTQTQFLLTLQDISARLLLLPKPARLSALRAELTALNHKLPSEVCFPLWCAASSESGEPGDDSENAIENAHVVPGTTDSSTDTRTSGKASALRKRGKMRHHRVVRINPSEAVVLNSADRAPYLLHVEVLDDDLDFDPDRRSNREALKKLVVAEDLRRRKFALSRAFGTDSDAGSRELLANKAGNSVEAANGSGSSPNPDTSGAETFAPPMSVSTPGGRLPMERSASLGAAFASSIQAAATPPRVSSPNPPDDNEEVDLTEQAFGADLAAFGGEREAVSEDEDDLTATNRVHDAAAWTHAREKSQPSSTGGTQHSRQGSVSSSAGKKRDFSLDEYSERMRTAAIMLAQLNQSTNAASQPAVTHNPHVSATAQGGWSSWIVGTSWASGGPGGNSSKSEIGQGSAGVRAPVAVPATGNAIPGVPAPTSALVNGMTTSPSSNPSTAKASAAGTTPSTVGVGGGGSHGSRLIHTDTEMIRKRIMQEMMALEEERMERMKSGSRKIGGGASRRAAPSVEDEATVLRAVNKDDPSAAMFRETWAAKKARIRAASPYGHLPSWDVFSVIVKTGADLRQEQLAVQLINEFGRVWEESKSKLWVRYFRILVTSESSGLMETVTDAVSVHSIKKEAYARAQKEAGAEAGGKIATYSIFDHFVNVSCVLPFARQSSS